MTIFHHISSVRHFRLVYFLFSLLFRSECGFFLFTISLSVSIQTEIFILDICFFYIHSFDSLKFNWTICFVGYLFFINCSTRHNINNQLNNQSFSVTRSRKFSGFIKFEIRSNKKFVLNQWIRGFVLLVNVYYSAQKGRFQWHMLKTMFVWNIWCARFASVCECVSAETICT